MDISFKEVSYIYQPNSPFEHIALQDITLQINKGSFVAIIGHTGSGKSTLIQHLNGLIRPTKGKVRVGSHILNADKKPKNLKKLRSQVGIVFQYPEHQLFEETVAKDIAFGPTNFGVEREEIEHRVEEAIHAVRLDSTFLERSPFDLSGGQMRRVAIAGVLASEPKVLILDEPTAGLDPRGQIEMMGLFQKLHNEKDLTTILVTHHMEDALRYADHIIILKEGKKYMEGNPIEIFSKRQDLEAVNLDVPDLVRFIHLFEERFNTKLPFRRQSTNVLAKDIITALKGDADD